MKIRDTNELNVYFTLQYISMGMVYIIEKQTTSNNYYVSMIKQIANYARVYDIVSYIINTILSRRHYRQLRNAILSCLQGHNSSTYIFVSSEHIFTGRFRQFKWSFPHAPPCNRQNRTLPLSAVLFFGKI